MAKNETSFLRRVGIVAALGLLAAGCTLQDGSNATRSASSSTASSGSSSSAASAESAAQVAAQAAAQDEISRQLIGKGNFVAEDVPTFPSTGTFVGEKVEELRTDLQRLRESINAENAHFQDLRRTTVVSASSYNNNVSEINTRLQVGTTPGNPRLIARWNEAQAQLNTVSDVVSQLNTLSNEVAQTSALSNYLLESVDAAYSLSGAVEEDHQNLAVLEDETSRTVVLIDRLLQELSEDISRQASFVATERRDLTTLSLAIKNGQYFGSGSLANQTAGTPSPAPAREQAASMVGQRQPLVVIRFDDENVEYEQPLYSAISQVLDRRPESAFEIVGVAPSTGNEAQDALDSNRARRKASAVMRSLTGMGLTPDRMSMAATSSPTAEVTQVHVYVR